MAATMGDQVPNLSKLAATLGTFVGFLTGMSTPVGSQSPRLSVGFWAVWTLVRLFARMAALVPYEVVTAAEGFRAFCALV